MIKMTAVARAMAENLECGDLRDLIIEIHVLKKKKQKLPVTLKIQIKSPRTGIAIYDQEHPVDLFKGDTLSIDGIRVSPDVIILDDHSGPMISDRRWLLDQIKTEDE